MNIANLKEMLDYDIAVGHSASDVLAHVEIGLGRKLTGPEADLVLRAIRVGLEAPAILQLMERTNANQSSSNRMPARSQPGRGW